METTIQPIKVETRFEYKYIFGDCQTATSILILVVTATIVLKFVGFLFNRQKRKKEEKQRTTIA